MIDAYLTDGAEQVWIAVWLNGPIGGPVAMVRFDCDGHGFVSSYDNSQKTLDVRRPYTHQ